MGFRFGEVAGDTHDRDAEDETPAKVDTPTTTRKPARTTKGKAAAATA